MALEIGRPFFGSVAVRSDMKVLTINIGLSGIPATASSTEALNNILV